MIYVYGRKECVYCDKAIALLDESGLDYTYIDIYEKPETLEMMRRRGHATVPQVYNGDIHIGGYTDAEAWLKRVMPGGITIMGDIRTGSE